MIEFEEKLYFRIIGFNFIIALILALIYLVLFGITDFTFQEYLSHSMIFFGAFGVNMLLIGIFFSKKNETK